MATSDPSVSEREQAEEQAEIDRLAREEAKDQARFASAQNSAFQLGKEGKGVEMRSLIEKFGLDVTKPRKLNPKKDAKVVGKTANFETMLHVAAGLCDVYLIDWLLDRGTIFCRYFLSATDDVYRRRPFGIRPIPLYALPHRNRTRQYTCCPSSDLSLSQHQEHGS
jgi:hypothetical protein